MFWLDIFWNQTDDRPRYSTFFFATGWNKTSNSICAILFWPAAGTAFSNVCRWELFTGSCTSILSFKITTASPMLQRFGDFHVAEPKKIQKNGQPVFEHVMVTDAQCKRGSLTGKPFDSARNVSGVSHPKFCLNSKVPQEIIDFQHLPSRAPMETSAQDPCLDSL